VDRDVVRTLAGWNTAGLPVTTLYLDCDGRRCEVCRGPTEEVPDLVEDALEAGLRLRCRVETARDGAVLGRSGGIGALLRF
jgi:hypothetical protein